MKKDAILVQNHGHGGRVYVIEQVTEDCLIN